MKVQKEPENQNRGSLSAASVQTHTGITMPAVPVLQRQTSMHQLMIPPPDGFKPKSVAGNSHTAVIQRGVSSSKSDENAIMEREYAKLVKKASEKLTGKIGFGASPEGKFDKRYWKVVDDKDYKLAIETTVTPSVAIQKLIETDNEVWSFDCAEFIQVCNLYATIELYDTENIDSHPLILRQHGSTPFQNAGVTFDRKNGGDKFDIILHSRGNAVGEKFIDEDVLLANIPAGSRVCFKNPAAPDTPFRNENAMALGGGLYVAHPMGSGLTATNIRDKLVSYNKLSELGGEDGGLQEIFVSQAEIYSHIPMGKDTKKELNIAQFDR